LGIQLCKNFRIEHISAFAHEFESFHDFTRLANAAKFLLTAGTGGG